MTIVAELMPGDLVQGATGPSATFVARTQHPLWPHLQLVVWRLADGTWSHDALSINQNVGYAVPSSPWDRKVRLEQALLNARLTAAGPEGEPADGAALTPFTAPASAPTADLPVGADVTPKRQYPCARCGEPLELPGPTHHECKPKVLHQGGEG